MALSQRSQGTRSPLLLKVERQSCVCKRRNRKLVQPKVGFFPNSTSWEFLLRFFCVRVGGFYFVAWQKWFVEKIHMLLVYVKHIFWELWWCICPQIWKFRNIMRYLFDAESFACCCVWLIFIRFQNNDLVTNVNWTFILCSVGFILFNIVKALLCLILSCLPSYRSKKKSEHSYGRYRGSISVSRNAQSGGWKGWNLDFN